MTSLLSQFYRLLLVFLFYLASFSHNPLHAHEIRPAYLKLKQVSNQNTSIQDLLLFELTWKQPLTSGKRLKISPKLPDQCNYLDPINMNKESSQTIQLVTANAAIMHSKLSCPTNAFQQPISIWGLSSTLTDVLVIVELSNGSELTQLLTPSNPNLWIDIALKETLSKNIFNDYLIIGFNHFLSGIDHVLFVFLLVVLVKKLKQLFITITAFTLAHSLTLGASALGWIHVSSAPIEAIIVLSIVFLAWQASFSHQIKPNEQKTPWLIAFIFGLLHGFGFSTALTALDIEEGAILPALLWFNLGVELGQVLMILVISSSMLVINRLRIQLPLWLKQVPVYAVGSIACFWFIQRTVLIL